MRPHTHNQYKENNESRGRGRANAELNGKKRKRHGIYEGEEDLEGGIYQPRKTGYGGGS